MTPSRKAVFAMLAAMMAPLVAGCMPETPRTALEWDVNDNGTAAAQARAVRSATARTGGARTYVYQENLAPLPTPRPNPQSSRVRVAALAPTPTARPKPRTFDSAEIAPATAPVSFVWPVNGPVIADFGTTASGGKNDGINIATAMDAPIRAAASGTVTYAGDELKGYGNLVLIKHEGGYTTAYAHADRLLVQRGDFVAKGQVIGYAGQTGDVSRPQLHFEIRARTTPVNPRAYLTTRQARG